MDAARLAQIDLALQTLAASANCPYSGTVFRILAPLYGNKDDALSGEGALYAAGRFNVQAVFRISYTGCTLKQAEWEFFSTGRNAGTPREDLLPITMLSADVTLSKVLDLTDARVRRRLGIKKSDITQSVWNTASGEALTQAIGRLAHKNGFEAILTPSLGPGNNLNLLPDNYLPGSSVKINHEDRLPDNSKRSLKKLGAVLKLRRLKRPPSAPKSP